MSLALHSVVGTIRVEPILRAGQALSDDEDSTLGLLLESLAFQEALGCQDNGRGEPFRLLVSTRLCRIQAAAEGHVAVRANLAQLLDDLTADYERLNHAADARQQA